MSTLYDSAALAAADRSGRDLWAEHRARLEVGVVPVTTAPLLLRRAAHHARASCRGSYAGATRSAWLAKTPTKWERCVRGPRSPTSWTPTSCSPPVAGDRQCSHRTRMISASCPTTCPSRSLSGEPVLDGGDGAGRRRCTRQRDGARCSPHLGTRSGLGSHGDAPRSGLRNSQADGGGAPGAQGALREGWEAPPAARYDTGAAGRAHPERVGPTRSIVTRIRTRCSRSMAARYSSQSGCSPATRR